MNLHGSTIYVQGQALAVLENLIKINTTNTMLIEAHSETCVAGTDPVI